MHYLKLSLFSILAVALLATASPLTNRDIATCEAWAAQQEVACIDACPKDSKKKPTADCSNKCNSASTVAFAKCGAAGKRDIASCEMDPAAEEVSCLSACPRVEDGKPTSACATRCIETATTSFSGCAGVTKRDVASCEVQTAADQVECIQTCPKDGNGKPDAACTVSCTASAVQAYVACAT